MLVETTAIILSRIKYSDSSLIVKAYTKEFGLKTFIAKGVRGKKKSSSSMFQSFSILELVLYQSKNNSMATFKSAETKIINDLIFDVSKSTIAIFLSEVINRYIKEEEKNQQLFQFISRNIIELMSTQDTITINNFPIMFLYKILSFLGVDPEFINIQNNCFCLVEGCFLPEGQCRKPLSIDQTKLFLKLVSTEESYTKQERRELTRLLLEYLDIQLSVRGKIKSLDVLEELSC